MWVWRKLERETEEKKKNLVLEMYKASIFAICSSYAFVFDIYVYNTTEMLSFLFRKFEICLIYTFLCYCASS